MIQARFHPRIADIPAQHWDALRGDDNPFLAHGLLLALEQSGSIRASLGWQAMHLGLYREQQLVAAAPLYLKTNSHGEFVFDWNWADAMHRAGLPYYPKLLCAVPYTPVSGPRLLTGTTPDPDLEDQLLDALWQQCQQLGASGVHINFPLPEQAARLTRGPWLPRFDWQYHWRNREYRDFADFLDALQGKKRKNIRQERQRLQRAGLHFQCQRGSELDAGALHQVHALYCQTFIDKGNTPALTRDAFLAMAALAGDPLRVIRAWRGEQCLAMAMCLRSSSTLYGRYWGCIEELPGLHFETCYYQGIELCLREGLSCFEPGAQGEHKIARGFLPTRVHSLHRLSHPGLQDAVARALHEERLFREQLGPQLAQLSPYAQAPVLIDQCR